MRMLWIALLLPALSYGWQADRIKIRIPGVGEVWSPFWVITCNDGYSVTGLFGDSGPDFTVGGRICKDHGGMVIPGGGPTVWRPSVSQAAMTSVTVADFVRTGIFTKEDAGRLTGNADEATWKFVPLELRAAEPGASGLLVRAEPVTMPDPPAAPRVGNCLLYTSPSPRD